MERGRKRVEGGHGEAEAGTQAGGRKQEKDISDLLVDARKELTSSSAIERKLAARPARWTRFVPKRRPRLAARRAVVIAVATCGQEQGPVLRARRSYSAGSVKIVLAAGNVTSTIPWTIPAA